jgi:VIT1/CCC1 family predicted Fe2+/Mn2+ transporter
MPTPKRSHKEQHSSSTETIRDVIIGMSDGLTVPFALAAGLTGAVAASHLILTAGLAEIVAGSISMGLGGYLAARSDAEHYYSEQKREEREVKEVPDIEAQEVADSLMQYGLTQEEVAPVVGAIRKNPKAWVAYMMRNELGLEEPEPKRAVISALTIAGSYIVGGIIPLSPYFFISGAHQALLPSVAVTLLALLVFGYIKGKATGVNALTSGLQTVAIGGIAAGAAFFLASRFTS